MFAERSHFQFNGRFNINSHIHLSASGKTVKLLADAKNDLDEHFLGYVYFLSKEMQNGLQNVEIIATTETKPSVKILHSTVSP